MNIRAPLAGAAALLWGLAIGHPMAGALLALVVEGVRRVQVRWVFERREFERVADLSSIALVVLLAWQWFGSRHAGEGILATLLWLPAILTPLLAMQRLGVDDTVPLTAFFWSLRGAGATPSAHVRVDLEPAFVWLCLLAGACANPRGVGFAAGGIALAAWLLWQQRGRAVRWWRFAPVFAVAIGIAWLLQAGLVQLQAQVEAKVMEAIRERLAGRGDGSRSQTAIGELGRLKLSGRLVARVRGIGAPPRLRDGSFETFVHDTWFARQGTFRALAPEGDANWRIAPGAPSGAWDIALWLPGGRGVLALPAGTVRLDGLNVERVEASATGTVRVLQGPQLVNFTARLARPAREESAPDAADLAVPASLVPALDAVIAEAALATVPRKALPQGLIEFFASRFGYTTRLDSADGRRRTLPQFLASDRRGHCEYFASAGTLLLRRLGVPARYVTGYAVHEWSALEGAWVVRARDGHAWTVAWVDGAWRDVDTTPSGWIEAESTDASWWEAVTDPLAWLRYRFTLWRQGGQDETSGMSPLWLLLIVPLAGWVAWGVARRSRRTDLHAASATPTSPEPGILLLEAALRRRGFVRAAGTSMHAWLPALPWADQDTLQLALRVARAYRRLRFDPVDPGAETRVALTGDADALRKRLEHGALDPKPGSSGATDRDDGRARGG